MGADLRGAVLPNANLKLAYLVQTRLDGAVLSRANLTLARVVACDFSDADLREADFGSAMLVACRLASADLAGAVFGSTTLAYLDLSEAINLEQAQHTVGSFIDFSVLVTSFNGGGNRLTPAATAFLRKAGVPDRLLVTLPHLVREIMYYNCFISYGEPDRAFAERLAADLTERGVSCWIYSRDSTPGKRTWHEIGLSRRQAEKVIVVCSAKSLVREGALKEIEEQIDEEPDKLIPISRDSVWKLRGFRVMRGDRDLGPWLRERNYADFEDERFYRESVDRLLLALQRRQG
jgi:hypothetical protein